MMEQPACRCLTSAKPNISDISSNDKFGSSSGVRMSMHRLQHNSPSRCSSRPVPHKGQGTPPNKCCSYSSQSSLCCNSSNSFSHCASSEALITASCCSVLNNSSSRASMSSSSQSSSHCTSCMSGVGLRLASAELPAIAPKVNAEASACNTSRAIARRDPGRSEASSAKPIPRNRSKRPAGPRATAVGNASSTPLWRPSGREASAAAV
eukprot:CAMPEP_0183531882 /NCGR_PEP_ID=MMETSP0371-20130417/25137_1 /TAXON_ID=268820 /ORGANISM="Peridinium aciculiferum, Strain PAER-2" /LENGTH=207 /DNA_ID=CAMNT_0025731955 /DNA_START=131 /DNA_END=752 /DNA_ORIENTATION=-